MNSQPRVLPGITRAGATSPAPGKHIPPEIDERPQSVYELITRQMLNDLRADLDEIRSRVNALLWLTVGAVLLDFVMRVIK
jgi:hypothetical protein